MNHFLNAIPLVQPSLSPEQALLQLQYAAFQQQQQQQQQQQLQLQQQLLFNSAMTLFQPNLSSCQVPFPQRWPAFPQLMIPNQPLLSSLAPLPQFMVTLPTLASAQPTGQSSLQEPDLKKKVCSNQMPVEQHQQKHEKSPVSSSITEEQESVSQKVSFASLPSCNFKQQTQVLTASFTSLEKFEPVPITIECSRARKNLKYLSKMSSQSPPPAIESSPDQTKPALLCGKRNNEDPYQNYEYISQIKNQLRKQVLKCFFKHICQYISMIEEAVESQNPDFAIADLKAICGFWSQFDNPTKRQNLKNEVYSELCNKLNFGQDIKPLGQKYLTQIFCQPSSVSTTLRQLFALFNNDATVFASRQKKSIMKKYYVETSNQIYQDIVNSTLSRSHI